MTDKPTLNGTPPKEKAVIDAVPDDVLRRMNHSEWLDQFSEVLGMTRPGSPPMTPMRQGAIQRLKLAARFIELLKKDVWRAKHERSDETDDLPEGR